MKSRAQSSLARLFIHDRDNTELSFAGRLYRPKVDEMLKKKLVAGFVLVASLGGVAVAAWRLAHEPAQGVASASTARVAPSGGPGWVRGARYSYGLSLQVNIGLPDQRAGATNGAEDDRLELTGTLHTTVVESDGDSFLLAYELEGVSAKDGPSRAAASTLSPELATPFYVKLDSHGAVASVAFAPGLSTDAQTLLRNLVAVLRIPKNAPAAARWSEREADTNGECDVRYACRDTLCSKEKVGYVRVISGAGLVGPGAHSPQVASSHFDYAKDAHGRLLRMAGAELSTVKLLDAPLRAELRVDLKLQAVSIEKGPFVGVPAGWNAVALTTPAEAFNHGDKQELPDDLRGATTTSLLSEYLKLDGNDVEGRGRSLSRLTSLLARDPAALQEARRLIREGGAGARVLAEVLGGLRTASGQALLASVVTDRGLEDEVRAAAMRSSLLVEQPTATLIDSLRAALDESDSDLRHRAMVAFGAGAQRVASSQPELARTMTEDLLNRLRGSTSPEERLALLRALGNTSSDAARTALLQAATDPDPEVRAAAMRALRFQNSEQTAGVLRAALTQDPSDQVRSAALFAAEFLPASLLVGTVAQAARAGDDLAFRGSAIRVLGKMASEAEALQALTDISTSDADPSLRELAGSLLNQALAQLD